MPALTIQRAPIHNVYSENEVGLDDLPLGSYVHYKKELYYVEHKTNLNSDTTFLQAVTQGNLTKIEFDDLFSSFSTKLEEQITNIQAIMDRKIQEAGRAVQNVTYYLHSDKKLPDGDASKLRYWFTIPSGVYSTHNASVTNKPADDGFVLVTRSIDRIFIMWYADKANIEQHYLFETLDHIDNAATFKKIQTASVTVNEEHIKNWTYTKSDIDNKFALKGAPVAVTEDSIKQYTYTKSEIDDKIAAGGGGGGGSSPYSKAQLDTKFDSKADKTDTYTKTEINTRLAGKLDTGGAIENANKLKNMAPDIAANPNTIVQRDGQGNINAKNLTVTEKISGKNSHLWAVDTANGEMITDGTTAVAVRLSQTSNLNFVPISKLIVDMAKVLTRPKAQTNFNIDFSTAMNFTINPASNGQFAISGAGAEGQSGTIVVTDASKISGFSSNFKFKEVPTGMSGEEIFVYCYKDYNNIIMRKV